MGKKLIESVADLKVAYQELNAAQGDYASAVTKTMDVVKQVVADAGEYLTKMKTDGIKSVSKNPKELIETAQVLQTFRLETDATADRVIAPQVTPPKTRPRARGGPRRLTELPAVTRPKTMLPVIVATKSLVNAVVDWMMSALAEYVPEAEDMEARRARAEAEETKDKQPADKTDKPEAKEEKPSEGGPPADEKVKEDKEPDARDTKREGRKPRG